MSEREIQQVTTQIEERLAGERRRAADAIDFLASSSASYVTGSVLDLDGGWSAYSWFYPARDL